MSKEQNPPKSQEKIDEGWVGDLTLEGRPVPVLEINVEEGGEHKYVYNEEALEAILCSDLLKNRKVCLLTVAGLFRQGKSFLLDYILRHLNFEGVSEGNAWAGEPDTPLEGFSWRSGQMRCTTGIIMWSKPFIRKVKGQEVAVLIMDTQGTFDEHSTINDNCIVFGVSALVASTLIYNLPKRLDENALQNLQLFTAYSRLAGQGTLNSNKYVKPFQDLHVLIRDFVQDKQNGFLWGPEGGKTYIDYILSSDSKHDEGKEVREHIRNCFDRIDCTLLPYIGTDAEEAEDYDGRHSLLREEFKTFMFSFVEEVVASLEPKRVNGIEQTGRQLFNCWKAYMNVYTSENMPSAPTLMKATAEAQCMNARDAALATYQRLMDAVCTSYQVPEALQEKHRETLLAAVSQYSETYKMGNDEMIAEYLEELKVAINREWAKYEEKNKLKGELGDHKTPVTLAATVILIYLVSHPWADALLSTFGVPWAVLNFIDVLFYLVVLTLAFYLVILFRKPDYPFVAPAKQYIEMGADAVWQSGVAEVVSVARDGALSLFLGKGSKKGEGEKAANAAGPAPSKKND